MSKAEAVQKAPSSRALTSIRRRASEDHPYKAGAKAQVYRLGSPPDVEALATIVAPVKGVPDLYRVRFDNEPHVLLRFAFPEWQHPRALDQLRALWRVTIQPEFLLLEFPWRDRVPGSARAGKAKRRAIKRSKPEGE